MSYPPPPSGGNPSDGGQGGYGPPPGDGGSSGGGYGPPPGGGGYGPPPGGGGYGQQPAGDSSKATWALVTGIVGLLCCGPLGIVAIVLGNQAKGEIAASGGVMGGGGKAQAGFILGIIAVVLWAGWLIVSLATGGFNFDVNT